MCPEGPKPGRSSRRGSKGHSRKRPSDSAKRLRKRPPARPPAKSKEPATGAAATVPARAIEAYDLPAVPARRPEAHKGDFGRVLIVAGSRGMAGAACLAAMGALRGGAGLVTIAVPESIWDVVASHVTEAMTVGLPEGSPGSIGDRAIDAILERCQAADVLALGPGLSATPEARAAAVRVVLEAPLPTVLDADGINAFAGRCADLAARKGEKRQLIATPHPGEMSRLLAISAADIGRDRPVAATQAALASRSVILLKGHQTVVADGQRFYVNRTGNPGMATGGSGDVLTGLIAALLAQGLAAFDAACLGAHLHGLAGDIAARELTEPGLIAGDIAANLPKAWRKYIEATKGT